MRIKTLTTTGSSIVINHQREIEGMRQQMADSKWKFQEVLASAGRRDEEMRKALEDALRELQESKRAREAAEAAEVSNP